MNRSTLPLTVALATVPTDLRTEVETSFRVPQYGPYHQEGDFLITHLQLVLAALEDMRRGEFHPAVSPKLRPELTRVANAYANLATLYVLLHDIDKMNCMTLIYADGTEKVVTWAEWQKLVGDYPLAEMIQRGDEGALDDFCEDRQITQVSYFQKTEGGARMHGKIAADRLRAHGDIPEIICKAIDTHEIAYQFAGRGGINLPLFRKVFEGMSDDELAFALLVNLADEMGSWGESGPDITPFVLLAETATAARKFAEVETRLRGTAKLDGQKLDKAIAALFKATDAFRNEDAGQAFDRIVAECKIPSYSEPRLHEVLQPLVTSGVLAAELLEPLVTGLVANGAIPSEVGKKLGKANQAVRTAIAGAVA